MFTNFLNKLEHRKFTNLFGLFGINVFAVMLSLNSDNRIRDFDNGAVQLNSFFD